MPDMLTALRQLVLPLAGTLAGRAAPAAPGIVGPPGSDPVLVRVLALNDFHGQLGDSDETVDNDAIGGAATLASYINRERQANPAGTIVVSGGDAFGASPPESSLLQDKPTLAVLAQMGVEVGTIGNHEWDRGYGPATALMFGERGGRRLSKGAAGNRAAAWPGASFPFVCANLVDRNTHKLVTKPYEIREINGVKVAFIGAVTRELKDVTMASGIRNVKVLDPAEAINRYIPEIKAQGVRAIVAMVHEGVKVDPSDTGGKVTGPIADVVTRLDPEIDAVVSAHSHSEYVTRIAGKLVTQARSYGQALAELDLAIDRKTGQVVASNARVIRNKEDGIAPDPVVDGMVKSFQRKVAPLTERVVSVLPGAVTRAPSASGESALGSLVAEAQRQHARSDIALMNPGGIRKDFTAAGEVTWGKVFGVQPFSNQLIRARMRGSDVLAALEQMFRAADGTARVKILQVSGIRVTYDVSRPIGRRITRVVMDDGRRLDPSRTYSVVANAFLMNGGDGFTAMLRSRGRRSVGIDLDALVNYLKAGKPVPLQPIGRMTIVGGKLDTNDG